MVLILLEINKQVNFGPAFFLKQEKPPTCENKSTPANKLSVKRSTMKKAYNTFIIGTGTAGFTLAQRCRKAGLDVAIADRRPMGGTCAMRGCQPKKYLVNAAEIAEITSWMQDRGLASKTKIDWNSLIRAKKDFTDPVPASTEKSFRQAGIDLFHGTVRFVSPEEVMIDETTSIRAEYFVVATGSEPVSLNIPGEQYVATSDDFLELSDLPGRIIFIGGGYISMEFAHVARIAGADVTVLEHGRRILKHFEPEIVAKLVRSAQDSGIKIVTEFSAEAVQKTKNGFEVVEHGTSNLSYCGDLIVHGAGRVPTLEALDLEAGDVAFSAEGIQVNAYLQSRSNPRVYAIGDAVANSPKLSTVADMEAEVAGDNIIHGNKRHPDYENIPSVVFSVPSLAGVGMTEEDADASGLYYRIKKGSMASWPTSRRLGQQTAFYKVVLEKETDRLLGVHILGHNAGEIINIFALAMKSGLRVSDLQKVLWAYPTYTSDLKYMIR